MAQTHAPSRPRLKTHAPSDHPRTGVRARAQVGHFALIRHLLPLQQAKHGSRVVTLSSVMHWFSQPREPQPKMQR